MFPLKCFVCSELVSVSEVTHVATCGHLFHYDCLKKWLAGSKVCPSCSKECTIDQNTYRVYFNANLDENNNNTEEHTDENHTNECSLLEDFNRTTHQLRNNEEELLNAKIRVKKLQEIQKCMKKNADLESKLLTLKEQIKGIKNEIKNQEQEQEKIAAHST